MSLNSCCFSSLESDFDTIKQTNAVNDISLRLEESLHSKIGNRIDFENGILKNGKQIKGKPRVYYSLEKIK